MGANSPLSFGNSHYSDRMNGPVRQKRVNLSGAVRGLILMAVVISGIFLWVRNLSGYTFSPDFIIFLDIGHLGTVMLYSMMALYCAW